MFQDRDIFDPLLGALQNTSRPYLLLDYVQSRLEGTFRDSSSIDRIRLTRILNEPAYYHFLGNEFSNETINREASKLDAGYEYSNVLLELKLVHAILLIDEPWSEIQVLRSLVDSKLNEHDFVGIFDIKTNELKKVSDIDLELLVEKYQLVSN